MPMLHHHQPKHDPERLWLNTLEPKVAGLREDLGRQPIDDLVRRSGAVLDGHRLRVSTLFDEYLVDTTDYVVRRPDGGEVDSFHQSLLLTYLVTSDGWPPAGRWVSFRDLPNGSFYNQAFQSYGPDRLAKHWLLDLAGFEAACLSLGGSPVELGDAGFAFAVLPRVDMAAVYWLGDEDFPSSAALLFDANAHFSMVIDGLAILGSRLVGRILAEG